MSKHRMFASVALCALAASGLAIAGPDVTHSNVNGISSYGAVGDIFGYALGSYTCNVGNQNLRWGTSWQGSPWLAMNAYRLKDGVLQQIGMSWVKNSCCAGASSGICGTCNGVGGSMLGVNCLDVYGSGYNGGQTRLGPRSIFNAFTGQEGPGDNTSSGDAIYKRLQVHRSDLNPALNANALYFVEGVYLASDETDQAAKLNNASHKRVTITNNATYTMTEQGNMQVGRPAIYAWRDHGLGVNVPDPSIVITPVDVPGEGRFYVGSKVTPLPGGLYRYDYAIFNQNSDRSASGLVIPVPAGVSVSAVTFKGVPYHSGEVYSNTPWTAERKATTVEFGSPQKFQDNANTNALRWGTMYNFSFIADRPGADVQATLALFKPGAPAGLTITVPAPALPVCVADIANDGIAGPAPGPDGALTGADFDLFVEAFFTEMTSGGRLIADLTDGLGTGQPDGRLTGTDFDLFVVEFFTGC